ncbi:MAG: cell division protein FtsZ, partial [Acidobacteria bacterium]|nr:cell division protein FtsZ [Acidobacteriota bacterium]
MGHLDAGLDNLKFEIQDDALLGTKIKVVGVGGGGANAVGRMMSEGMTGVEFHILNTDVQALNASPVPNKLAIGSKLTNGLGAGSDPEVGRQAALEDTERIIEILEGADMVFVTAGLGGGTGTGAAPVVASLAKGLNALTVAVVTKPFGFEGPWRMKQAEKGLAELGGTVDTVISIPNDRLLELVPKGTSLFDAFRTADDVLRQAVQGISDIMTTPGIINRDFSDIRAIMLGMGYAMMGTASAKGENAAVEAAEQAISCALLEEGGVRGARGVLINITGSSRLGIHDVNAACTLIRQATHNEDVQINFGVVLNEAMQDEVKITVIATGFERENLTQLERRQVRTSATPAAPVHLSSAPVISLAPEPVFEELKSDFFFEPPPAAPPAPRAPEPPPQAAAEP